ncbi:L-aspartate oxidase [Rhizobium helianthi]|uniref:L-aspartate oxidase n=1 Tax=Rhizobium helianthi TaxID=1132695 RepID=A0ABW4LZG8_9HYPH
MTDLCIDLSYDVVIVGGGLAGQALALSVADQKRVLLISKNPLEAAASNYAQGGISAVYGAHDSHEKHIEDTLVAGCHLNDRENTRFIVEGGLDAVQWLIAQGVPFTKDGEDYHLTREGGHGERRILHVDDMTGRGIQQTLTGRLKNHGNITLLEHYTVVDLITTEDGKRCIGVTLLDAMGNARRIAAGATVLATGGVGAIFQHATSPSSTIGDGVALAWRAGCRVANMEFLQFHPTCMYYPGGEAFLITEAVRGEGGLLKRADGTRFMDDYDPRAELAPRDVVSRAIYAEMKKTGQPCVYLDISHKTPEFVRSHFPNIYRICLERGIDITRQPIPVTPASHYTCGGIFAGHDGKTDLEQLLCLGEAAYTGLHGANRLASNSLLECVVMARAAAEAILADHVSIPVLPLPTGGPRALASSKEDFLRLMKQEIRALMWNYVGIVRSTFSLRAAARRLDVIRQEVFALLEARSPCVELIEARNLVITADLIIRSALSRKESRGCHYNTDFPDMATEAEPTVLMPHTDQQSIAA